MILASKETHPEGSWKELGPQGRRKEAARPQKESHMETTTKPQDNYKPQKHPQEKNEHDIVRASDRVRPRSLVTVHITSVVWASRVRFDKTTATTDV